MPRIFTSGFTRIIYGGVICAIFLFTLSPIIIIIMNSFTEESILTWPPKGFSFGWYYNFVSSPVFTRSLWVSLQVAALTSFLSLAMGFGAAYGIDRYAFPGKNFVETFLTSPLMIPLIIIGIGILQFISFLRIGLSIWTLIVAHVIICMPYVVKTMRASLLVFDRAVEEAALTLGAKPARVLIRITLPMLKSGFLASAVFSFIYSFNNLTVSLFLSSPRMATLPVEVYTAVEGSADPTVLAIASVIIGGTFFILILVQKVAGFERFM